MNRRHLPRAVVGLIPAGGAANRLAPIPCSKEIFPLGFQRHGDGTVRPKAVCHYLLDSMRLAGIRLAYVALRPGKWDVPAYLGDGALVDMNLAYLTVRLPYGVPYTLDQAFPFVRDAISAIGYPDILFRPVDAYSRLLARLDNSGADVVLGAVPWSRPDKGGMLEFDAAGRVHSIAEKPGTSAARYSFCTMVWTPRFSEFLHERLRAFEERRAAEDASGGEGLFSEVTLAEILQQAIDAGLHLAAEVFPDGGYLDVGTPEDLVKATQCMSTTDTSASLTEILAACVSIDA